MSNSSYEDRLVVQLNTADREVADALDMLDQFVGVTAAVDPKNPERVAIALRQLDSQLDRILVWTQSRERDRGRRRRSALIREHSQRRLPL